MTFKRSNLIAIACALGVLHTSPAVAAWEEIDASAPFVDRYGVPRFPSCSGGPELVPPPAGVVPQPADTSFSFFVRYGDTGKLAIFWDGGGACWEENTCIGTALLGSPIYTLSVDETTASLDALGGLGDIDNPENPIADYTQVFIPYCTGDLHIGARDTEYLFETPAGTLLPWTIHHRGADNTVAVLEWLVDYYQNTVGHAPSRVVVAGASAGGYGVLYHYPAVAALLPWYTRTRVLVDAANGVINQDFYDRALSPGGVWNVWENLSPQLTSAFAGPPESLIVELFKSLGAYYPRTRIGQYTTAFDATQIFYFNVTRHVDSPHLWLDAGELFLATFQWTLRARANMWLTALYAWNYRFYLAQGTDHTIVASDKVYLEQSAGDVAFIDWLDDMINRFWIWGSNWRNLSCAGDCLP